MQVWAYFIDAACLLRAEASALGEEVLDAAHLGFGKGWRNVFVVATHVGQFDGELEESEEVSLADRSVLKAFWSGLP